MTLKIKLLVIMLFCIRGFSQGQETSYQQLDSLVTKFVEKLQYKNIDTICIYKNYCVGCYYVFENKDDECICSTTFIPTYILWLNRGKTFLSKKDNCFDYSTIEIDSTFAWDYFLKNKECIAKEHVKPFEYVVSKDNREDTYLIIRDHSNRQDFKMIVNDDVISLHFDEFDLEKECDNSININYEYNQSLKGKIVINELEKITEDIENKSLLKKRRRIMGNVPN
jgi:hypothetical protein